MAPEPLFFLHVMKTGGSALVFQFMHHYEPARRYPGPAFGRSTVRAKGTVGHLRSLGRPALSDVDLFAPHLPAFVIGSVGFAGVTATVLRHPVERACSHLLQVTRAIERRLESPVDPRAVFEIDAVRGWLLTDHQVRVFALHEDEAGDWDDAMDAQESVVHTWVPGQPRPSGTEPVPMDERRLADAIRRLESFDVVGVREGLQDFADRLASAAGIALDPLAQVNVGGERELPADLLQQIAADNRLDMLLYERASALAGRQPAS